jgi:hypothetical protein
MNATQTTVTLENKSWNKRIDSYASRINGKTTTAKVMNMFLNVPEDERPSREYVKAYLKAWWSWEI